jgi:ATP-dependent helicase Lhr and Lhr-like helicase
MEHSIKNLLPRSYNAFFGRFPQLRPSQEAAIPLIHAGRNVLLISPTGSGKTEAVVAPVTEQALDRPGELICIYICPTRALVNDIERRIQSPLAKLHLQVGVRHGDRKTLRGKTVPSILITTPESLDVMLGSKNQADKGKLRSIRIVIVDEVHQFYQTHRGYQLTLLLERLKRQTRVSLHRLLLSATVGEPTKLACWFQGSDTPFEILQISGGRLLQVGLDHCNALDGAAYRLGNAVSDLVLPIVEEHNKVLLFANSRNECDWLYWRLKGRLPIEVFLHYSTLEKRYREHVERQFQRAERALCIATSTLELGIDIGDIDAVVMYGAPASISSFVQRTGRGNRRSSISRVYGLCREYHIDGSKLGAENDLLMFLALVGSLQSSELETRPQGEYPSVYVQQFFSLAYQYESIVPEVLEGVLNVAHPQTSLEDHQLTRILSGLSSLGFFQYNAGQQAYYPTETFEGVRQSLQLWGNIPAKHYDTVIDTEREIPVSHVPRGSTQPGHIFLFAGEPRIVIESTGGVVMTRRLAIDDPKMIVYDTMGTATPPEVALKAREILSVNPFPDLPVELDDGLLDLMKKLRRKMCYIDFEHNIPYENITGRFCYYIFGGTWANEILSHWLREKGYKLEVDSWRLFTTYPISMLDLLPTDVAALNNIVKAHLSELIRRFGGSFHFYQLPKDLQLNEICSFLDLPRIATWFQEIKQKKLLLIS